MERPIGGTLAIETELRAERAAALGRASERLLKTLDALARFDGELATLPAAARNARQVDRTRLRDEAGQALWYLVIQREALGITGHEPLRRHYPITDEVWAHMGPMRKR